MEKRKSNSKSTTVNELGHWWKSGGREYKIWVTHFYRLIVNSIPRPLPLSSSVRPAVCTAAVLTTGAQLVRQLLEPSHLTQSSLPWINWTKGELQKWLRPCHDIQKNKCPESPHSCFPVAALNWKNPVMTLYRRSLTDWLHQGYDRWAVAQSV